MVDIEEFARSFVELSDHVRDGIDLLYEIIPRKHGVILVSADKEWFYEIRCERNRAKHCPCFEPVDDSESHEYEVEEKSHADS